MLVATTRNILVVGALLAATAPAQVWVEVGDAPSFPDGPPQVTRGEVLDTISGSTGDGDLRDAYCIRIVEADSFLATTDPIIAPGADASFDTRLFLFRRDGAPVLANDDRFQDEFLRYSTLTGEATDGSGFVLTQPGEYVLIIAGYPDDPEDPELQDLFDISSDYAAVHAPDPTAGRFDHWEEGAPATGTYDVFLAGVTPCQNQLDAVFSNTSGQRNRLCLGDGLGGFTCSDVSTDENASIGVALGFVDGDQNLDAVFANDNLQRNRLCLGDGLGGFTCADVSADTDHTESVALGEVGPPLPLYCFSFDCCGDGIEIMAVMPDKTVVGTWRNWDANGATAPVLGGYSGKDVSPRLSWLAARFSEDFGLWSVNLNVDARTFDVWEHLSDFTLIQWEDDQPYTVIPGACPFGPENEGLPASTGVGE